MDQLPKAMTKYRKLNTTQHTAREAKKQRQGQLQAGIAMALGGEAAAGHRHGAVSSTGRVRRGDTRRAAALDSARRAEL